MKKVLKILFIDDNDVEDEIENIQNILNRNGIELEHYFVDVSGPEFKETVNQGTDKKLVSRLILNEIEQKGYLDLDIDIVACDFNLKDDYVNGYDLICDLYAKANVQKNRRRIRKARLVFYTGEVKKLSDVLVLDMKKFLILKAESVVDRPDLVPAIVGISNSVFEELNLESFFLESLEPFHDKVFSNTYPQFRGKALQEICKEIEKETHHGREFLRALVEFTVANMIELQAD